MANIVSSAPFVSIVMPVHNGGTYFELALRSALAQSYDRFEVVVVDDGSTDNGATERTAAMGGDRVRLFGQENRGVAGALNTGIAQMRGDFFCWLSHDDLFEPDKTALQVAYHARLGKTDSVLFSDYDLIGPDGAIFQRITADRPRLLKAPMLALLTGSINGCTIFAPADVMRDVGEFETQYRYTQDYRFWNRLLKRYEFFHQPRSLVRYRIHPDQGSNNPQAIVEGDALWIEMMRDRTEVERAQMMGSTQRFFEEMANHLSISPYREAEAFARDQIEVARNSTPISLVVPVTDDKDQDLAEIMSWADHHAAARLDVVVAARRNSAKHVPMQAGYAALLILDDDASEAALVNAALPHTRGSYVTFARPGRPRPRHSPAEMASRMQRDGMTSLIGIPFDDDLTVHDIVLRRPGVEQLRLEDLMIHRSFIDGGVRFSESALALEAPAAFLPFCVPALSVWKLLD